MEILFLLSEAKQIMNKTIHIFTVSQIKRWIIDNEEIEGLSTSILSKPRGYAIINNPYVEEDTPVLCAIYDNDLPIAYTAAFPEKLVNPDRTLFWFSTLYCRPEDTGKGYGLIVVGSLCEVIGIDKCADMNGAEETQCIFSRLGLSLSQIPRYALIEKNITCSSIKGKLVYIRQRLVDSTIRANTRRTYRKLKKCNYSIEYKNYIDNATYQFILKQSSDDGLIHSQKWLNWILRYPFFQYSPLTNRIQSDNFFTSYCDNTNYFWANIYENNELIGCYMIKVFGNSMNILFLYYIDSFENSVFSSIAEHVIHLKIKNFHTVSEPLYSFLKSFSLFPKEYISKQSFSYPLELSTSFHNKTFQAGDGDVFI